MRHRGRQLDVAHALTTNDGTGHFDAALVADDTVVTDALVFAAIAFPVLGRTKRSSRRTDHPVHSAGCGS